MQARLKVDAALVITLSCIFSFQSQPVVASSGTECAAAIKNLEINVDQAIQDLAALKLSLDLAKVEGKNSPEITALLKNYKDKEQVLIAYIEKNKLMTKRDLVNRIKQKISVLQNQSPSIQKRIDQEKEDAKLKRTQEKVIRNTVIGGSCANFYRIEHGKFDMGQPGFSLSVKLTKSFDMMSTPTSQLIYREIAELANRTFPKAKKIVTDPSFFKNDLNPVESVSYIEVQEWIKSLNRLSQLDEPLLNDLIPDHKKGDVYRLPTSAEWEFVIRGRGTLKEKRYFGDNDSEVKNHAWYDKNSGGTTHPVAQKSPLTFEGKDFYDLLGNVREWTITGHDRSVAPKSVDPIGSEESSIKVVRGGSFEESIWNATSYFEGTERIEFSLKDLGFRLVRVVQ